MLRAVLLFLALALPAQGEEVVAGLSQNRIAITTNFDGSEILIFGAIKRETAIQGEPLQILVTVEGPSEELTVRRKEKRFGIWVNTDQVDIAEAPSFYAIATSAPFDEMISPAEDILHHISTKRAVQLAGLGITPGEEDFAQALIRIRENAGLYQTNIGAVNFEAETLFRTTVRLPANLHEGDYRARFFLTRDGKVVDTHTSEIAVQKVGLERFLFRLSRDKPLVYGLMSLAIAIAAGWSAAAAFRVLRL